MTKDMDEMEKAAMKGSDTPSGNDAGDTTSASASADAPQQTKDAHKEDAHDSHDEAGHDEHAGNEDHDEAGHSGHGAHGDDDSDASTLVPTKFSQLILPLVILLLVGLLVAGPVMSAFSSNQPPTSSTEGHTTGVTGDEQGGDQDAHATPSIEVTPTHVATEVPATPTTVSLDLPLIATQTAVALAGEQGEVARMPVKLEIGEATYSVQQGSGLLPDWDPAQEPGIATWIAGTVANHILYIPYDEKNAAIFTLSKPGDILRLEMNTGQVFEFQVNLVQRVLNGPATEEGQFTVSTAMAQDHAGVTLFLTGDPAADRAVVQADFTGNIQ